MHCKGSITIIWSRYVFINYLAGGTKSILSSNQSPTCAYSQSVSTFIWC